MTSQNPNEQKKAAAAQRNLPGDPKALELSPIQQAVEAMKALPVTPSRREELCIKIRSTALECAARTTVDMDPKVTTETADEFVGWILRGISL